jgi:hypothetical protein
VVDLHLLLFASFDRRTGSLEFRHSRTPSRCQSTIRIGSTNLRVRSEEWRCRRPAQGDLANVLEHIHVEEDVL